MGITIMFGHIWQARQNGNSFAIYNCGKQVNTITDRETTMVNNDPYIRYQNMLIPIL